MATKKTIKENPITTFRKNFENRSKIVKSSLKKAQDGIIAGPQTEMQSKLSDAMNAQPAIPRPNRPSYLDSVNPYNPQNNIRIANEMNAMRQQQMQNQSSSGAMQSRMRDVKPTPKDAVRYSMDPTKPKTTKGVVAGQEMEFTPEQMKSIFRTQKKGGPVYKKGGATKATKFAALAKPFNKATAADRIAGAKKNARKKK
jgi:flagellar basal body rod protein FlgB